MKNTKKYLIYAGISLALFAALIVALLTVDVADVGPLDSEIGFSAINNSVFKALGENELFYTVSEIVGYLAIATVGVFGLMGLAQLIKRKSLLKVDIDLYSLAVLYVMVAIAYVAFEIIVINYRPVLEDGELAASFPSSHTMLIACFMFGAARKLCKMFKSVTVKRILIVTTCILIAIGIASRLLSGVHWLTDIVGSLLLSCGIIFIYCAVDEFLMSKYNNTKKV